MTVGRAPDGPFPADLGFGTDYEKRRLSEHVQELMPRYRVRTVAEWPCNVLLGDSREVFAAAGIASRRLAEPVPLLDVDLVFSFCEFEQAEDPTAFLKTLDAFGSRYVLLVTQNWRNPGVPLHRLWHAARGIPWDHGCLSRASYKALGRVVRRAELPWRRVELRTFDTPWFILDVYETGTFLRKLVPARRRGGGATAPSSVFERWPFWASRFFAHHFLVLYERTSVR